MAKESRHVAPGIDGAWGVRKTGATRASKVFNTEAEAVRYGKALARRDGGDLYVHSKSGAVREHVSFKT